MCQVEDYDRLGPVLSAKPSQHTEAARIETSSRREGDAGPVNRTKLCMEDGDQKPRVVACPHPGQSGEEAGAELQAAGSAHRHGRMQEAMARNKIAGEWCTLLSRGLLACFWREAKTAAPRPAPRQRERS